MVALESISDPVSIYEPVYSESGDALYVLDQISDRDTMESWLGELSLRSAIRKLGRDTGSKAARDKLIQGNLRLVLSVIQRFTGRGEGYRRPVPDRCCGSDKKRSTTST